VRGAGIALAAAWIATASFVAAPIGIGPMRVGAKSALAGQIVTQPIPGRQQSTSAKLATQKSATVTRSSSAAPISTSGGLKWKSPQAENSQDADKDAAAKSAVAATSAAKSGVAKSDGTKSDGAKSGRATTEPPAAHSPVTKHAAARAGVEIAALGTVSVKMRAKAAGSNGIGERLKELESNTAAGQVQRIANHDDDRRQVIQTAATEPKIDPFGDDEKPTAASPAAKTPAAKTSAKRDGTPARRAAQAGVQPGRQNGPNDPFPGDKPLEQMQAEPPGKLPTLEEGLTQAPRLGPQPCPSPRDLKPLNQISNKIDAEPGEFPSECGLGDEAFDPRQWSMTTYTWKATGLCHKPLYFEDVQLERYGNSCSPLLQPVISGAHFFASATILPYKMGLEAPCECIYPLGTYRPGSCAPFYINPLPISARGALYQTGTVLGLVFLIP
jgi:hypothetical protein